MYQNENTMKVVIAGGGFAGLKLARRLANKKGIDVWLIDRINYHQFQPLFYQVATAGLDASNISFPLRKVFQHARNVHVRLATLTSIDTENNTISTSIGTISYDVLVIATGADTNFFGNAQLQSHAFPMKSTVEALQLRHRLLQNFEDALVAKDADPVLLRQLMQIVVVGGGPTGVEVSGALAEMRNHILPRDFPELDFTRMNIYLVEGSAKTLGAMSEKSSTQSSVYLQQLGVKVLTNTVVQDYDGKTATLSNGEAIETKMLIWAAGIRGNIPEGIETTLIAKGNRIRVDRTNKVVGTKNIYAVGDIAYMETPLYPEGHPQVANAAIGQAENLAGNLLRQLNRKAQYQEYEYKDKGSMATVGKHLAVVDIPKPKIHFGGWLAWFVWMSLHLVLIVGVKNRLQIFINWVYKYFTYDQSLRLIFKGFDRMK